MNTAMRPHPLSTSTIWATLRGVLTLCVLLVLVEAGLRLMKTPSYIFPKPSEIWEAMVPQASALKVAWTTTMGEAFVGLGIAVAVSSALAAAAVFLPGAVARMINASGVAIQSTPLLAIAPLLSLWMGQSFASKAAAATIVCFFPLLTGWLSGVRSVGTDQLQLMENIGAGRIQRARHLLIPTALPYFFGGLRVAMPLALLGAIVGEFIGSSEGIGFRILSNSYYVRTAVMFGYVIVAAGTGWALTTLIGAIERKALFWHGHERRV